MLELLDEAEIQHLAMSSWGLARLHGTKQATGPARDFFCRLADHLRRRTRTSDRTWKSRWDGIFLSHVSIMCWSYARVLSADKVTRRLLKSASKQLETFTEEGAIKAQEHANLLWAYAQAADEAWAGMQKPRVMLDGLVQLLCDPKLKLLGESSVSFASSASALARIRPMISPVQQRALGLWMERSSGRLSRRKDFELDGAEVIGLLRALVACSRLQSRMLSCCLKVLQKDSESLAPSQMLVVLLALRTIRPRRLNDEQLWFLRLVQSRFEEFRLPQLALALWRLHGIQEELADGAEMRQMIESGTARFRSVRLRWPQPPWRRHAEPEADETPSADQTEEVHLSMEDWRWLANSALPCPLLHDEAMGPQPWTAKLLRPFASWVAAVVDEIKAEADLLVGVTSSFETSSEDAVTPESFAHRCLVEETVRQRYRAVVQRDGLAWTGPVWGASAAQRLGLHHCPAAAIPAELKAFLQEEPRVGAWLQAKLRFASSQESGVEVLQHTAEDGDPADHRSALLEAAEIDEGSSEEEQSQEDVGEGSAAADSPGPLLAARDKMTLHADFQVLNRLAKELAARAESPDDVSGKVFLYVKQAPRLSGLGAMRQLRSLWPGLSLEVSFGRAPGLKGWIPGASPNAEEEGRGNATSEDSASQPSIELKEAIIRFLESSPAGQTSATAAPVALVGTDPRVRELWKQVCSTGVRPSGKGTPRKKREWQDKLKYFIAHRYESFCLEEGAGSQTWVRLRRPEDPAARDEDFGKLQLAIKRTMLELLQSGKVSRDDRGGEGYVLVEDVACTPRVYQLWHLCRSDSSDRLAFYLRHTEAFEVWTPGWSAMESEMQEAANLRSAVRIRLQTSAERVHIFLEGSEGPEPKVIGNEAADEWQLGVDDDVDKFMLQQIRELLDEAEWEDAYEKCSTGLLFFGELQPGLLGAPAPAKASRHGKALRLLRARAMVGAGFAGAAAEEVAALQDEAGAAEILGRAAQTQRRFPEAETQLRRAASEASDVAAEELAAASAYCASGARQQLGEVDVLQLLHTPEALKCRPLSLSCGPLDFVCPSVARRWLGAARGRGVVAQEAMEEGTLFISARPLARVASAGGAALSEKRARRLLAEKLEAAARTSAFLAEDLFSLYDGSGLYEADWSPGPLKPEDMHLPTLGFRTRARIDSIVRYNAHCFPDNPDPRSGSPRAGLGLWLWPPMVNHALVEDGEPNCAHVFVGDVMLFRTTRPVAKGEELLDRYTSPLATTFQQTEGILEDHGMSDLAYTSGKVAWTARDLPPPLVELADSLANLEAKLELSPEDPLDDASLETASKEDYRRLEEAYWTAASERRRQTAQLTAELPLEPPEVRALLLIGALAMRFGGITAERQARAELARRVQSARPFHFSAWTELWASFQKDPAKPSERALLDEVRDQCRRLATFWCRGPAGRGAQREEAEDVALAFTRWVQGSGAFRFGPFRV
ncbi:ANKRD50 [Symbiodinium sp. CCMP2592]|nr:ANKRD50 [Symbiodinium sp. CCMP2592]